MRKRKLEVLSIMDATKLVNTHPCCDSVKVEGVNQLYGYLVDTDVEGKNTFTMVCRRCYDESPE